MSKKPWSWGKYPLAEHRVVDVLWSDVNLPHAEAAEMLLPYGMGRSYGDVPLNHNGTILRTQNLKRFIHFDTELGLIKCESGVTLGAILELIVPHGWFLPVTPGTQFATVGGAIANDVHGKNHHVAGSFCDHVNSIEILRSDRAAIKCSRGDNKDLFSATTGGLGLTGLILNAEIKLLKISGSQMGIENIAFPNLDAGLELFEEHDKDSTYTVAWIDCLSKGNEMGRGIFTRAEHADEPTMTTHGKSPTTIPFEFPSFTLNKWSIKVFNELYYQKGKWSEGATSVDYRPFFYPLDQLNNWNRIYGKRGFFQYQCVIPFGEPGSAAENTKTLLKRISQSGAASFLAVLKRFGHKESEGLLSFPRPGITLALDLPNKGLKTLSLLESLDRIVRDCGGRVYPAKDARMSEESFKEYYPNWEEFSKFVDPSFCSDFWRRVTGDTR